MKVKLGADKEGKLTAFVNDFIIDNGAYQILGIVVGLTGAPDAVGLLQYSQY